MSQKLGCEKGTANLQNQTYYNFKHETWKTSSLNAFSHLQEFASMNGNPDLTTTPATK